MHRFLDRDTPETRDEPHESGKDDSCPTIDITLILGSMDGAGPPCPPDRMKPPQKSCEMDWKELALSLLDMMEDMGIDVDKMREGNDGTVSTIPAEHQGLQEQGISVESSPRQGFPKQGFSRQESSEREEAGDQGCCGENGEEENDPRTNSNVKKRPAWKR